MRLLEALFGPPPRDLAPRENARPRAAQRPETDENVLARLNQLETTLERVQLDQSERQLAVLAALEKVMHQLRARERKRAREAPDDESGDDPEIPGVHIPPGNGRGNYPGTAELALRRYRRF